MQSKQSDPSTWGRGSYWPPEDEAPATEAPATEAPAEKPTRKKKQ